MQTSAGITKTEDGIGQIIPTVKFQRLNVPANSLGGPAMDVSIVINGAYKQHATPAATTASGAASAFLAPPLAEAAPLPMPQQQLRKKKFTVTRVSAQNAAPPAGLLVPVRPSSQNLSVPHSYLPPPTRAASLPLQPPQPPASAPLPNDPYSQDLTVNSFADFIVKSKSSGQPKSAVAKMLQRLPRMNENRARRRLVFKNGDCNVSNRRIQKVHRQFLADIYTSIVDLKWRYILLMCATTFMSSWLFFGALWWLIGYAHGDFAEDSNERPSVPCMLEVHGFVTAFLYSIETQHTIGYGGRQLTDACPEAVVLLMIQSIFGMIMQALTTGAMFAKLARPKKRAETLMFSRNAVICKRDGHMCLMFRIGDMRRSHLVGANVRALMIRRRVSKEGEVLPLDNANVVLGLGEGDDRLMIVWPLIVLHRIDASSPFWEMSRDDLERENFELIVILEGVIEATGMTTQARTSYLPGEILWGHRLERLITFQKEDGRYKVDYSRFHATIAVDTPTCSAKDLHDLEQEQDGDSRNDGSTVCLVRSNSTDSTSTATRTSDEGSILLPEEDNEADDEAHFKY